MSALAGIDQALWDIKGKAFGAPPTTSCRCSAAGCATGSRCTVDRRRPVVRNCQGRKEVVDLRFTAVKDERHRERWYVDLWTRSTGSGCASRRCARRRRPCNIGIGVDFHGRAQAHGQSGVAALSELHRLMFCREPVLSEHASTVCRRCASPHPDRTGREAVLLLGLQDDLWPAWSGHHPARPVALWRHHRGPQDRAPG